MLFVLMLHVQKQMYRPDYVQLHFVHYSTVTSDFPSKHMKMIYPKEETEAAIVHAKSIKPESTLARLTECVDGNKECASIGYSCQDDAPIDPKSGETTTKDSDGTSYCNCFVNHHLDNIWVPKLEQALAKLSSR
jgi:hypothetical protein